MTKKKNKEPKKMGRPSVYTDEIAKEICRRTAQGESLIRILKTEGMPGYDTVLHWKISKNENLAEFQRMYAKAKEDQADYLVEEILDISDNGTNDWMESQNPENPGYKFNGEHYQRSRLRVDTRKWAAAKLLPKKYAEKINQGFTDNEGKDVNIGGILDSALLKTYGKK